VKAFLTPDNTDLSSAIVRRCLCLPGELWYFVDGAVQELCEVSNWETFGDMTTAETAEYFRDVLDDWSRCSMVGMIVAFGTETIPDGFLPCDGSEYYQNDYPELFDMLEDIFKPTPLPGQEPTFLTPNLNGRFPLGTHTAQNIGIIGGNNSVTLIPENLPEHDHSYSAGIGSVLVDVPSTPALSVGNPAVNKTTGTTGDAEEFDILPPFIRVKYGILAR
jgi:microcystin-dependent protein